MFCDKKPMFFSVLSETKNDTISVISMCTVRRFQNLKTDEIDEVIVAKLADTVVHSGFLACKALRSRMTCEQFQFQNGEAAHELCSTF